MPAILNTDARVVAALVALSLAVPLLVCSLPLILESRRRRRRTRSSRRGGYLRPFASAPMKDGGRRTPGTGITALISSYYPLGLRSAGADFLAPPVPPNRPTALTSSGSGTGVAGANGARALAQRVGCPEYGGDAA